ncbi:hypothetical protein RclHR1_03300001 [Rhizophagus clarus]|uniref:Ammonia transport outward protein 2-like n=1 Tax=Rhizophagus clarus TaxID=94130 RepID=A0A2Z6RQ81_9GLOM|nr:hypothetical protein RclHR1_03300001 [Rhizophagus clarus]GES77083.1 ammonia transport outward protein 2-like [Rhizophagus clarus]
MSSLEDGKLGEAKYTSPKIANPAPLGLCGFALTTFVLSIHNSGSVNLPAPDVVLGLALFYGGLAQLLAGMWEFKAGNTFGATAFSSYGAFWLSFASLLLFKPAAPVDPAVAAHAAGIFLLGWTIFTFILFLATFRSNVGIMSLFFFLTVTFLFLTLGKFFQLDQTPINGLTKAGGVFGIITALIAWYNALAGLLTPETSYFTLPTIDLSRKNN